MKLVDAFNELEGVTCNDAQGSLYAFPQIHLSAKALQAAKEADRPADAFYCLQVGARTASGWVCGWRRWCWRPLWLNTMPPTPSSLPTRPERGLNVILVRSTGPGGTCISSVTEIPKVFSRLTPLGGCAILLITVDVSEESFLLKDFYLHFLNKASIFKKTLYP